MQFQYLDCVTMLWYANIWFLLQPGKIICSACGFLLGPHISHISTWVSEWLFCVSEKAPLAVCSRWLVFDSEESAIMRPLGWISELCAWSPWVKGTVEITFVWKGVGRVCVPSVAFPRMPLVSFNHGSDVDLNSKCAWHQIPNKERVRVVAVQPNTDSTYWRLKSFRFIRLIEPTHSKKSTLKYINLQWMRKPSFLCLSAWTL